MWSSNTEAGECGSTPKKISEEALKMRLRVGLPVSVQYVLDGENRVISSVVVDD